MINRDQIQTRIEKISTYGQALTNKKEAYLQQVHATDLDSQKKNKFSMLFSFLTI